MEKLIKELAKIICLVFSGGIFGLLVGAATANFFPDKCSTGPNIICQSPIQMFGLGGYEALGILGLLIGATLGILTYAIFVWDKKCHKQK